MVGDGGFGRQEFAAVGEAGFVVLCGEGEIEGAGGIGSGEVEGVNVFEGLLGDVDDFVGFGQDVPDVEGLYFMALPTRVTLHNY